MKIYVGNLSYSVTEKDLKDLFAEHGEVSEVTMVTDKFSGQSKGFGFIEMPVGSEAEKAIKALDGVLMQGRNIKVNQARPKDPRPRQRSRY